MDMRRLVMAAALAAAGCVQAIDGPGPGGRDDPPPVPPPPVTPPAPTPATYARGSMTPLYQLLPRDEYGRLVEGGVAMSDRDYAAPAGAVTTSVQSKLDEIGAQIGAERGGGALAIITRAEDQQRARTIPFRGNPSDVDFVTVDGRTKLFVPLGGDVMNVGNEVAAVDLSAGGRVTRVKVGIRPQRVAVHPSGLVFVCNQYSNYVSIIDARRDRLLATAAGPVEIATEMFCTDLVLVPRNSRLPDGDDVDLYVANDWRGSVLQYGLTIVRDPLSNDPVDVRVTAPASRDPANQPAREITGVAAHPLRLHLGQDQRSLYVAANRGGELSRIDLASGAVRRIGLGSPAVDVVQINDAVIVPTTMPDRGLLPRDQPAPPQVLAAPVIVQGEAGATHLAHPGALFDGTRAYNFEDVRNGVFVVDAGLTRAPTYFTDDVSPEANFTAAQKVLTGALPQAIVRNAAGTRVFVAMAGTDEVQELAVRGGAFRLSDAPARDMATAERPFALALNEAAGELYVAAWGGEVIDVLDIASGERTARIDLGYASPTYPATNLERGEYFYYNTDWSNNGRKSCASCHTDELMVDGFSFANGATAPTALHKVPASFNLLTTDSYFWNGSFANGSYASLASDAQTRTNCELILFGLSEGVASDPSRREGDPANRVRSANDALCRPDTSGPGILPANFAAIGAVITEQKLIKDDLVRRETGLPFADVARLMDFWSVSELRLPPNPLRHLADRGELDSRTAAELERGEVLFRTTGCVSCHQPDHPRQPYADGLEHGAGSAWRTRFVETYLDDPRLLAIVAGGIPQVMLDAISASAPDAEINVHLDPIDYFIPFCFDLTGCLVFDDPLVARGNQRLESERLAVLAQINLGNAERGFVPGNVRGQPAVNTPSLRGVWWQGNLLHHGLARSFAEAILPPGHPALRAGEVGYAMNRFGAIDVHGATSELSAADVAALSLFVQSIE
jgi:DNA-binding beta-propeller fold protein YncE